MPVRPTTRTVRLSTASPAANPPASESVRADPAVAFEPLTVRIPTAIKLTGIGRSKLYELIASGDIEIVKIGTATLITMSSLRRLVTREAGWPKSTSCRI